MERKKTIKHFRDLEVYQQSFTLAMELFRLTKKFPQDERYSIIDQIRRSSRAICANLAEAWRKRKYMAVFKNKLSDAMQEASETQCWLEFSFACEYIDKTTFNMLDNECENIIAKLNAMVEKMQKNSVSNPTSQLRNFKTSII